MNDLNQMTTPVLQDWWDRYVCPACMSKRRETTGLCLDPWHSIAAVTYECAGSAFSPLSIPVTELRQEELQGERPVEKYGHQWTRSAAGPRRRTQLSVV
jgi:hypothetical protein